MTALAHTPALTPAPATPAPITLARGDGIGPEIMDAALAALHAAGARLQLHEIRIGKAVYDQGITSGIETAAWNSLRTTGVLLKGPITTPQGGGVKSLNVTLRKTLGLYANVRPCAAYHPFVQTRHPAMDVVIIRENEEDTYAGIEHRQTQEVTQCLKLITRPGCEKIIRYAFDYALAHGRSKVTCMTKDNIMKLTDGLFHKVFNEIAAEYPTIESDHWIIDIGSALLADTPEVFDVIVTPNLYGDILSDIAAQISGGVGLGGSSNIGPHCALFEAIHGSAPTIAGQGIANPSGLMLASVAMLVHLGQSDAATRLHNAWLKTLEEGLHTADIYDSSRSKQQLGTQAFAQAVIDRIGEEPHVLKPVRYTTRTPQPSFKFATAQRKEHKQLVGLDVFLDWDQPGRDPMQLGDQLTHLVGAELKLKMITNRGVKVYPDGFPETCCTDHWRCRFIAIDDQTPVTPAQVIRLLSCLQQAGFDFVKTEHLYTFDGVPGYSRGQGE